MHVQCFMVGLNTGTQVMYQIYRLFELVHNQCFMVGLNTGKKGNIRSTDRLSSCMSIASL